MRVIAFVAALLLAPSADAVAENAAPLTVPLIKQEYPFNPPNIHTVYVRLLSLGERKVDFPLFFDTGATGLTVDCRLALPPDLCSHDGIRIKDDLELDGIRVTPLQIRASYGSHDEYGNLAYARVAFGDARHPAATDGSMPFLIRYKSVRRGTGEIVEGPLWPRGMFGVSPVDWQAGGMLISPMDKVHLPEGLRRGFYLTPFGEDWSVCMNEFDECPSVDALHIGIDDTAKSAFEMVPLGASRSEHYFAFVDACLTWQESQSCAPTLYDTGNSTIAIPGAPRSGTARALPSQTPVMLVGPNVTLWSFATRYAPEVEFWPHSDINLIGIRYFETNSLLFDLDARQIGFRIGR